MLPWDNEIIPRQEADQIDSLERPNRAQIKARLHIIKEEQRSVSSEHGQQENDNHLCGRIAIDLIIRQENVRPIWFDKDITLKRATRNKLK